MSVAGKKSSSHMKLNVGVIVAIVVVALVAYAATSVLGGDGAARTAVIQDADGETHTMSLACDGSLTVNSSAGVNMIEVHAGKVRVIEADCPNQDCVEQGWVSEPGQQIICLPHKLVVTVTDEDASPSYDVVGK